MNKKIKIFIVTYNDGVVLNNNIKTFFQSNNLENIKIIELEITFIKKYLIYTVNVNFISPQNLFNKHFSI
jgi:hypothetical protein